MNGVLALIRADIRRRWLQSAVIATIALLASGTITLGLTLLQTSSRPWDAAFDAQRGAHLAVRYARDAVGPEQLRSTPSLIGADASGGPWPAAEVQLRRGGQKWDLNLDGRDSPGGSVEILRVVAGRWARSPGEVVLTRSFAERNRISVGDRLTVIASPGEPSLDVVGEAVDIDEGDAELSSQTVWVPESQVAALSREWGYRMVYRFPQPPSQAQLSGAVARLRDNLPAGAVISSLNYLLFRQIFVITNQIALSFMLAFGIFALATSAATIANLVTGIVLSSYREIGIMKMIGCTPQLVVGVLVCEMLGPALAGCLVGVPAGSLVSLALVDRAAAGLGLMAPPTISPLMDVVALAGVMVVVLLAAGLPALRVGRLSAAGAMAMASLPERQWVEAPRRWLLKLDLPRPVILGIGDAFRRPLRAGLTGLAILIGVAGLVFAVGLRATLAEYVEGAGVTRAANVVVDRSGPYSDASVTSLLDSQAGTERVVAIADSEAVVPGLADPVNVIAFRGDSERLQFPVISGTWFHGPGEVLAPRATLDEAHLHVGDSVTVTIQTRKLTLRVVGETFSTTNFGHQLLMDWSTLASVDPSAQPSRYYVTLRPGVDARAFARQVEAAQPDFLSAAVTADRSVSAVQVIDSVIAVVSLVLVLLALAGVFNTMLLNMREWRRDTAVLKALGMTPVQVATTVTAAAAVLGVLGGAVGVPAGVLLHRALLDQMGAFIGNHMPAIAFDVFDPLGLAALGLTGLAFALLGSVFPALRAARTSVANVLRTE